MSEVFAKLTSGIPPKVGAASGLPPALIAAPPSSDAANLPASSRPPGMVEPPNINLYNRPTVHNPDGSISSVRTMTFEEDGKSVAIPTVSDDGRILSPAEAIALYRKTGKHLGKFAVTGVTPWQFSDAFAELLHDQYAAGKYGASRSVPKNVSIQTTPWNPTIPVGK
jgi:hypothetical protein